MSNLPILYFTLGMLAGLPPGYRMAAVWYEEVLPAWAVRCEVWTLMVAFNEITRQVDVSVAECMGAIKPKAAA